MMFLMATDKYNCSEKSLIENFALCSDHIILSRAFRNGYILNICNLIYTTRRSSLFLLLQFPKMMTVSTLFVIQFFFLFVFWIMFSGYMIFCQPKFLILYDYKIISILFIQFYTLFFFYVLSSFLFPAHKRLIYVSISFRLFRKFYRSEIVFYDVWFPVYLKTFGGYTFSCSLNNSGLNFLNSKPFVISVLCDLLIQIDLLGFSPLQFFKVSWKKVPARFFCF